MGAVMGARVEGTRAGGVGPTWPVPEFLERSIGGVDQRRLLGVVSVVAAAVAFLMRWTQDDSYISLRFARNLVEGRGLVYNAGEQVEGYTNFLWTVLMAVPLWLGRDPVLFGHLLGIAAMVGTILATAALGSRVFGSRVLGTLTALVLLTNWTFVAYGTGGLETQLQTCLVAVVWLLCVPALLSDPREVRDRDLWFVSAAAGLALLTRLDSAVILVVPLVALAWSVLRGTRRGRRLVALALPATLLVVPWTWWRLATYGSLLPNTAVAKANPLRITVVQGASYVALFIVVNLLFAFVPTAFVHGRQLLRRRPFVAVLTTLGIWLLYLAKVGSDFMEFRFMVAVMPLLALVLVALVVLTASATWQKVLLGVLVCSWLVHGVVMGATGGVANVDSASSLDGYVTAPDSGLAALGTELGDVLHGSAEQELPGSGGVVLSTGGAGAIPYLARLRNVDPLGLVDPWTAVHGTPLLEEYPKPGHARIATFGHLVDEGVHLMVGPKGLPRPDGYGEADLRNFLWGADPDLRSLRGDLTMVEIPIAHSDEVFQAIYLTPHPDVDAAIRSGRWREVPFEL